MRDTSPRTGGKPSPNCPSPIQNGSNDGLNKQQYDYYLHKQLDKLAVNDKALAFRQITDTNERYAAVILCAACKPIDPTDLVTSEYTWRTTSLLPTAAKGANATSECQRFFSDPSYSYESWQQFVPKWDNLSEQMDSDADGMELAQNSDVMGFLSHLEDAGGSGSDTLTMVGAAIGSILSLIAFGLLALGVIVGKLMLVICIVTILFEIITGIIKQDTLGAVGSWAKRLIGFSFFTSITLLLFSIIALFASIVIMTAGALSGGTGGFVYSLVVGLAPAFGIGILVWVMKKAGLPNPLSIKGALAYARSAEGVGSTIQPSQSRQGRALTSMLAGGVGGAINDVTRKLIGGKTGSDKTRVPANASRGVKDHVAAVAEQERLAREQELIASGHGSSHGPQAQQHWATIDKDEQQRLIQQQHHDELVLKRAGTWRDPQSARGRHLRDISHTVGVVGDRVASTTAGKRLAQAKEALASTAPVSAMTGLTSRAWDSHLANRYEARARAQAWMEETHQRTLTEEKAIQDAQYLHDVNSNDAAQESVRGERAAQRAYLEQIARDQAHSHYVQRPSAFTPPTSPLAPPTPQSEPVWPEQWHQTDETRDEQADGH